MILYSIVAALLFGFFSIKPFFVGPVGIALQVSISMIGGIGVLLVLNDYITQYSSSLFSWRRSQITQFMELHIAAKALLVAIPLALPIVVTWFL